MTMGNVDSVIASFGVELFVLLRMNFGGLGEPLAVGEGFTVIGYGNPEPQPDREPWPGSSKYVHRRR